MINLKKLIIILISVMIGIIIVEIFYNLFFRDNVIGDRLDRKSFYQKYSKKELDRSLPIRHQYNGGECVKRGLMTKTNKMNWHPRYGANDNEVNINCINKLFSKKTINIIFFGGSAMQNDEAPNYLTSIDYFAFKNNFDTFRSINLANSGARMSNNLASFIEYVPKISNVDHVVFFDGMNEFAAVQLGSNPLYDTYWAQGVKARINNPKIIVIEKLISKSIFFEILFTKVFNYKSIRDKSNSKLASKKNIQVAASDYNYRKKIVEVLCKDLLIKCHFLIQPSIYFDTSKKSYSTKIKKYYQKVFDKNLNLFSYGYNIIISENKNIIDFSNIFDGIDDIFIDSVHFNKKGSKIIGENIFKIISNNI